MNKNNLIDIENMQKKVIYNKNNLTCVGTIQKNTTFEWEVKYNVIPNFKGNDNDYAYIETKLEKFHLENKNGTIVAVEDELSNDGKKQVILNQLKELDKVVPDIIEDIIKQGNYKINKTNQDIINQKAALRQQLSELT